MSEMVERVAQSLEPMCRGFGQGDMPMAIAREFAHAAIAAMREPTEEMAHAMLMSRTYFDQKPRMRLEDAERIGISDKLAGNPVRWCMPDWRAAIDEALRE